MEEGAIYFHIIYSLQLHINTRFVIDLPRYLIPRTLSLRLTPCRMCKGISQLRYSLIKFYPVIVWTGPDTLHTKSWSKAIVLHYSQVSRFTQGEAHDEPVKPINTRGLWSAWCWEEPTSFTWTHKQTAGPSCCCPSMVLLTLLYYSFTSR